MFDARNTAAKIAVGFHESLAEIQRKPNSITKLLQRIERDTGHRPQLVTLMVHQDHPEEYHKHSEEFRDYDMDLWVALCTVNDQLGPAIQSVEAFRTTEAGKKYQLIQVLRKAPFFMQIRDPLPAVTIEAA